MPNPNRMFELSIDDLALIESALREKKHAHSHIASEVASGESTARDIHDLLGRLHNQKVFYRPASGPYVGG